MGVSLDRWAEVLRFWCDDRDFRVKIRAVKLWNELLLARVFPLIISHEGDSGSSSIPKVSMSIGGASCVRRRFSMPSRFVYGPTVELEEETRTAETPPTETA